MKLKKICKDDIEELVDIYINTFSKKPWYDEFNDRNLVVKFFNNHLNNNYFIGYILLLDNNIIGMSLGMKKPWENGMEYYIDQFLINYEYQNKGYGKYFLKEIENDLKKLKINGILLNTERDFLSYDFYIKNGFSDFKDLSVLGKEI